MAKKPETRHPRLVRRGDVVRIKGSQLSEVVRDVSVVLHMANGQDQVFHVSEEVELGEEEEREPTPKALAAAAASDAETREEAASRRAPKPPTGRKLS